MIGTRPMRLRRVLLAGAVGLAGCASWHWEKPGGDLGADERYCKLQTYSGADGMVTSAQVRAMHHYMESRGWRKVAN